MIFLLFCASLSDNASSSLSTELIVGFLTAGLGFYARIFSDPLGMLMFSILNLCLFLRCTSWIEDKQTALILMIPFLFMNQIRSVVCVFKYGKEKINSGLKEN